MFSAGINNGSGVENYFLSEFKKFEKQNPQINIKTVFPLLDIDSLKQQSTDQDKNEEFRFEERFQSGRNRRKAAKRRWDRATKSSNKNLCCFNEQTVIFF